MTLSPPTRERFAPATHLARLQRAAAEAGERGLDALLITPSRDYAYLLGYEAPLTERLTCLVVTPRDLPTLILPGLEEPLARHQLGDLAEQLRIEAWDETTDPFTRVRHHLAAGSRRVAVQDQMWARFALGLQAALDPVQLFAAGAAMASLRRVKSPEEVERLRAAAAAADEVMTAITSERLSGRSEAAVSARIRELLLAAGHESADFAIVGSGPNAASPHHEPGDRVIEAGDAVVLDLGGTRSRYCSDTTRTAFVGMPPPEFAELYAVLQEAQAAACDAVRPGIRAEEVDAAARTIIEAAGYGPMFMHRTGHGIGMETHEEPYLVAGNAEGLRVGEAFSVEPGIYIAGQWGARIEDILVCTDEGGERLNRTSRDLYLVD